MKNNLIFVLVIVSAAIAALIIISQRCQSHVRYYTGDSFDAHGCTNLGLLGNTPHPTAYLQNHDPRELSSINLEDFLDMDYLRDSYARTFALCNQHQIDNLLIAYLPIYFVKLRTLLGNSFVGDCMIFIERVAAQMKEIIEQEADRAQFHGLVTLVLPPAYQFARVPDHVEPDERPAYLIKQFPRIAHRNDLKTVTIINNQASPEDAQLVTYLKYEYLFEKPLDYQIVEIGKARFHEGLLNT